jgi:hypothetical protein
MCVGKLRWQGESKRSVRSGEGGPKFCRAVENCERAFKRLDTRKIWRGTMINDIDRCV